MFLVANIDGITILQMLFRYLYCQFWEVSQVFQVFFFFFCFCYCCCFGRSLFRWVHRLINGSAIQPKIYITSRISDFIENSSWGLFKMNNSTKIGLSLNTIKVATTSVGNISLKWSWFFFLLNKILLLCFFFQRLNFIYIYIYT